MKPASPALVALLASSTFVMADLWTFALLGGETFLYSGATTAVTDATTGRVFALGPRFERSTTKVVIGIQSDELDVRIYPLGTDFLGSTPWLKAVWQGQLDGATVTLERAFMPSWGNTSPGTVVLFTGRVSDTEASRTMIAMKVRSPIEYLNIPMGRRLWQASCTHNFGDPMCGYDRIGGHNANGLATGAGALTFAAAAGSSAVTIQGAPSSTTPFTLGTVIGISGANAGQKRTISGFASGQAVSVKLPFLSVPAVGDSFQLLPGCDRTQATCFAVFRNTRADPVNQAFNGANAERFGGFPFIPVSEDSI